MPIARTVSFLTLACCALLSACVTTSNLPRANTPAPAPDEAVIVLGVEPRYRVALAKGQSDGTKWNRDHNAVATVNLYPEDGYLVVKVPARAGADTYGLMQILPEGVGGYVPRYLACTGDELVVMQAPAGKVTYVGDVAYRIEDKKLSLAYTWNSEKAKAFMAANYPQIAAKLEPLEGQVLTMNNTNCGTATLGVTVFRPARAR